MESFEDAECVRLCRSAIKGLKERKYAEELGLPYRRATGPLKFNHPELQRLGRAVVDTADNLKDEYTPKEELCRAMDARLFADITGPLLLEFAHRIWTEPNGISQGTLVYTKREDEKCIARNLFCWVIQRFGNSKRTDLPANTQAAELQPLSTRPVASTTRNIMPYIARRSDQIIIGVRLRQNATTPIGDGIEQKHVPAGDTAAESISTLDTEPTTNISHTIPPDQEWNGRVVANNQLDRAEIPERSEYKRGRETWDEQDEVNATKFPRTQGTKAAASDAEPLQSITPTEHDNRMDWNSTSNGSFCPYPYDGGYTSGQTYITDGLPLTSRQELVDHVLQEDIGDVESGTDDATDRVNFPTLLPPSSKTVQQNDLPDTSPAEPTAFDVSVTETEQQDTDKEHQDGTRVRASDNTHIALMKGDRALLRAKLLDILYLDRNRETATKETLQLVKKLLNEDSERLSIAFKTDWDINQRKLNAWTDFVLAVEQFRHDTRYSGTRKDWIAQRDLPKDKTQAMKSIMVLSNAISAWYKAFPGFESVELTKELGSMLHVMAEAHVVGLDAQELERLVTLFNVDIMDWFEGTRKEAE